MTLARRTCRRPTVGPIATLPPTVRRFEHEYAVLMTRYDVLLSPVLATPAPPIGHLGPDLEPRTQLVRLLRYVPFTAMQNVAGAPAISLPMGTSSAGLPIGVQAAAAVGREDTLLGSPTSSRTSSPGGSRPSAGRLGASTTASRSWPPPGGPARPPSSCAS